MTLHILPVVGSKGFHEFAPPFDTHALDNAEYECKAVRRLSDILANNEDPQKDIYEKSGLTEDDYQRDLGEDAYVVSFQSSAGHWLYIPYRYILKYPSVDGVPYRSAMIVISLPSIPVGQDLTSLKAELVDIARTSIGADVSSRQVGCRPLSGPPRAVRRGERFRTEAVVFGGRVVRPGAEHGAGRGICRGGFAADCDFPV
jgi:hypothetical protein